MTVWRGGLVVSSGVGVGVAVAAVAVDVDDTSGACEVIKVFTGTANVACGDNSNPPSAAIGQQAG